MIIPAVPMPIRVFADRLREDQGRQLGRAVLFASVVGFDVVERRKGDIAAISGVSTARIQEIVDTGRQALNTASPRRPEQHLISQALMRQFCIPTNQGDRLLSYNLRFGGTRLLPTRQVGKLRDFVKIDSEATEQLWGLTEQDLPAAIKAVRTRRVLQNPRHVEVIKDAIALHFARSLDTLESVEQNWQQTLAAARAGFVRENRLRLFISCDRRRLSLKLVFVGFDRARWLGKNAAHAMLSPEAAVRAVPWLAHPRAR